MSEVLTVRLSRQNLEQIPWMVWSANQQEIIASGELNDLEALSELSEYAHQRSLVLMLDGQDVSLKQVDVPAGASRQLATMLPFLLEEELAQDIDELHFSILKQSADVAHVCIVDKAYLKYCLQVFLEAGIEVHKVLPDVLALPVSEPGQTTLLPWDGYWLIRQHEYQGMILPDALLEPVFNQPVAAPQEAGAEAARAIQLDCFGEPPLWLAQNEAYQVQTLPIELPMAILSAQAQISPITLLTGEFKRQSTWLKHLKVWRAPAVVALCLLLVFAGQSYLDVTALEKQAVAYRAESERIFRNVFPDKKRIPTVSYLKRQMSDEKARLAGGTEEALMLPWLAEVQSALQNQTKIKIQSVKYDGNREELRIQAQASDFQTFERVRLALAKRFAVEQGQINRNGDLVSSSYVLKVK